jgi:hypothetical protein
MGYRIFSNYLTPGKIQFMNEIGFPPLHRGEGAGGEVKNRE